MNERVKHFVNNYFCLTSLGIYVHNLVFLMSSFVVIKTIPFGILGPFSKKQLVRIIESRSVYSYLFF